MKYNFTFKVIGKVLTSMVKKDIKDKELCREIKKEYKAVVLRADDIGSDNTLITSYALCAYFIAMNRKGKLTPDENIDIMEKRMRESKAIKMFMGDADGYFSEKHMEARRKWSKKTHERKYEGDWVVDVVEKNGDFEFGLDYYECGDCKMCRKEGCFELAKYLCRLDYMLVDMMGIKLKREGTLAQGCEKCDFRFCKK